MIFLKTEEEIELLRAANQLVAKTLTEVGKIVAPGVTTQQLNKLAEEYIRDNGGEPTFLGFPNPYGEPFPASICASVNDVVVHGVPNNNALNEGDIVSVDCGVLLNGFNGDSCYTFRVGEVSEEVNRLLKATKESLYKAIEVANPAHRLGDIGYAVQNYVEAQGYGVVREFVGHGIGRDMHEDPQIPNYGKRGDGKKLKNGLCIAIEPMITMGNPSVQLMPDKWTVTTQDGKFAAHYEHTIAIHNGKADILSSFEEIEKIENQY